MIYKNKKELPQRENSLYMNGLQFSFVNMEDKAVIDIDGAIGFDIMKWLEDEPQNDAETIKKMLRDITAPEIVVNINSPGGDVNDGLVIHDLLQEHPSKVTTVVRGLSASAATIISQAGYRKISKNSRILVHKPMAGMGGWFNVDDLQSVIDDLNGIEETILGVYVSAGTKTKEEYLELMSRNSGHGVWISADEALEWGLVDEVYEPSSDAISVRDFKNFGLPPIENASQGAEESISNGVDRYTAREREIQTIIN